MSILDSVEASLKDFRPKTHRQLIVFNIAARFDDLSNLARYLNVCDLHPKRVLLEERALKDGMKLPDAFFQLLLEWRREEGT